METWLALMIGAAGSIGASSGLWAYLQSRNKTASAADKLLLGLARNLIVTQGMIYISRGFITHDEYEDFEHYLFQPYKAMGGNGLAEKVMDGVKQLPFSAAESPVVQKLKERTHE